MWTPFGRPTAAWLCGPAGAVLLAACADQSPTAPGVNPAPLAAVSRDGIAVCHRSGAAGRIITIPSTGLAAHLGHGDYVTGLAASHGSEGQGDGVHFRRIGDALDAARAGRLARGELRTAACRITITVAAGVFRGSDDLANTDRGLEHLPFVIDVPDITLHGGLVMGLDAGGRATGASTTHERTTIDPIAPLSDAGGDAMVLVLGGPTGSTGDGLTLEGFALRSGRAPGTDAAGWGVFSSEVKHLTLRGNRFEGFFQTMDLRGSSGLVQANHVSGSGQCDVCIAGPGVYRVSDNRILAGATHGIFASPAIDSDGLLAAATIVADISNNVVRDHRQQSISAGIRIGTVGLGSADVRGSMHITVHGNLLVNNNFGLMIDGLFPQPGSQDRGDLDLTATGNIVRESCQAPLLVAFGRHLAALEGGGGLLNSTYRLTLSGDLRFSEAWFSNPAGFGNTLVVNGRTIGHRIHQFFDPTGCPDTARSSSSIAH